MHWQIKTDAVFVLAPEECAGRALCILLLIGEPTYDSGTTVQSVGAFAAWYYKGFGLCGCLADSVPKPFDGELRSLSQRPEHKRLNAICEF